MVTISPDEANRRPPDVKIMFSEGNYDHALECYYRAKEWVVETGQVFRRDIYGILQHPHHPQCRVGVYEVPPELIDARGWSTTLDIWCANENALNSLKTLKLPEGAVLHLVKEDRNQ